MTIEIHYQEGWFRRRIELDETGWTMETRYLGSSAFPRKGNLDFETLEEYQSKVEELDYGSDLSILERVKSRFYGGIIKKGDETVTAWTGEREDVQEFVDDVEKELDGDKGRLKKGKELARGILSG